MQNLARFISLGCLCSIWDEFVLRFLKVENIYQEKYLLKFYWDFIIEQIISLLVAYILICIKTGQSWLIPSYIFLSFILILCYLLTYCTNFLLIYLILSQALYLYLYWANKIHLTLKGSPISIVRCLPLFYSECDVSKLHCHFGLKEWHCPVNFVLEWSLQIPK